MGNFGTQRRLKEEEAERAAKLLADLGPRAQTLHAPGTSIIRGSATGKTLGGSTVAQPAPVRGVRMNTIAEIMVDESENRYL